MEPTLARLAPSTAALALPVLYTNVLAAVAGRGDIAAAIPARQVVDAATMRGVASHRLEETLARASGFILDFVQFYKKQAATR